MGIVLSKSEGSLDNLLTFRRGCFGRSTEPLTKYPIEEAGGDDPRKAVTGTPAQGYCVAGELGLGGSVDSLPWLFPDPFGPGRASTIFMNVWGNNVVCSACQNVSTDYRGTVFQCCKAVLCSRCTVRACLGPAERLRLDIHKDLSSSGRVLERVGCPACKSPENVGFPVNGNYGRIYSDSGEALKKTGASGGSGAA